MRSIVIFFLNLEARLVLRRFKPTVIAITGSVGKSSAKEALFTVLSARGKVMRSYGSYNTEFGVPLTVLDLSSAHRSLLGWVANIIRGAWRSCTWQSYPTHLIVEMGADRKDDIRKLTTLCPPSSSVLTAIAPVHLEQFQSIEDITKEKRVIVEVLPRNGWACLNADDSRVLAQAKRTKARVITYGITNVKADVRASDMHYRVTPQGVETLFKIHYRGSVVPMMMTNIIGTPMIYAALVGVCGGLMEQMNIIEIGKALKEYRAPSSRLHVLSGIKRSWIIDDSYNASPQAVHVALETFWQIPVSGRRIVVLGDMAELGSATERYHEEVGRLLLGYKPDILIAIGASMVSAVRVLIKGGFPADHCFHFDNAAKARMFIQEELTEGDWTLVKGSQVMRMETIVKEIMAEPLKAKELLCRQEEYWK